MYLFLRTDLPLSQQAVQAGHAAFECGQKYSGSHPSFVFLEIENKQKLEELLERYSPLYKTYPFYESYNEIGLTAFAIEPITKEERAAFSSFKLWRR